MILLAALSLATPLGVVPVQGALHEPDGTAISGVRTLTFRLYSSVGAPTPVWSEATPVAVHDGAFAAELGQTAPLDLGLLRVHRDAALAVVVNGVESTRIPIRPVPRAVHAIFADDADLLAGTGLTRTGTTFSLDATHVAGLVDDAITASVGYLATTLDPYFTTEAEVQAMVDAAVEGGGGGGGHPVVFATATGNSAISRTGTPNAANWTTIPGMQLTLDLAEPAYVLIDFDINLYANVSGGWFATRLVVNGVGERGTHANPYGGSDEEEALHVHRILELPAGQPTVSAQWGWGSGEAFNPADQALWSRTLSAVAVPVSSGARYGYVQGTTTQCKSGLAFADIPEMSLTLNATEEMVVLSELDLTLTPSQASEYLGIRLARNGTPGHVSRHSSPGSALERRPHHRRAVGRRHGWGPQPDRRHPLDASARHPAAPAVPALLTRRGPIRA